MDVPYGIIADCFRNKTVIPFLGAATSYVDATGGKILPGGKSLAKFFANKAAYPGGTDDPLTKVAQYLEEIVADRQVLLQYIADTFCNDIDQHYRSCLTDFLTTLPIPLLPGLIITTNYDILPERALERRPIPYIAISHIMRGTKYDGRWVYYQSLESPVKIITRTRLQQLLYEFDNHDAGGVIIYKMHGTAKSIVDPNDLRDTIVLTETDYVDFLATDVFRGMPATILQHMHNSRLLFLGYSLTDWNFRVLLRRLHRIHGRSDRDNKRHWACINDPDPVETKFWDKRGVNLYPVSLKVFLDTLTQRLSSREPLT